MENSKWLFIGNIPILVDSKSLAKQLNIEMWLDKKPIFEALGLEELKKNVNWKEYVV